MSRPPPPKPRLFTHSSFLVTLNGTVKKSMKMENNGISWNINELHDGTKWIKLDQNLVK